MGRDRNIVIVYHIDQGLHPHARPVKTKVGFIGKPLSVPKSICRAAQDIIGDQKVDGEITLTSHVPGETWLTWKPVA